MVSKKIGLAGKSGSGKDVVADYLCQRYGYTKVAVADAIRDETADWLRNTLTVDVDVDGYKAVIDAMCNMIGEKPTPSGIRVLLQWWGTEFRRSQDSLYWVKRLITRLADASEFVVVSDVRTPDEIDAVRAAGGELWFVERPGVESVGIPNHYTEIALANSSFERTIYNEGTLFDLKSKIDWIVKEC